MTMYQVPNPRRVITIALLLVVVLAGLVVAFGSYVTIPAGYKGVLTQFGAPIGEFDAGLHFKAPIVQSVSLINIQVQKVETTEASASSDLQDVSTTIALNYQIDPTSVTYVYTNFRDSATAEQRVISPAVQESVKAVTAKFTASDLIDKREDVRQGIENLLRQKLAAFHIEVTTISITNFEFSPSFTAAIEAKVTQQQKALEAQNKLLQIQYEAQQQVIQANATKQAAILAAEGQARARVITAEAEANATRIVANATAYSIQQVNEQLQNSPDYLRYTYIKQWNGVLPSTILGGNNTSILYGIP